MPPSSEQYAQLAAMFTTSENEEVASSIELLLPAHLPVQGGLWLVPYAGREAAHGTAILVRMHEDTIDVAVLGQEDITLHGCESIEDVLERTQNLHVHWVVQPPSDANPTSLLHCDADRVTLLSGADQAAVVGAYRLLKGLISTTNESAELPKIQLVVVGAEERLAADAASRIVQTAHHQLDVHIDVGQALPAMGSATKVVSQVTFQRSSNVVDLLGRIRNGATAQEDCQVTPRFTEPEVEVPVPTEDVVEIQEAIPEKKVEQIAMEKECASFASHVEGLLSIAPRCPEHDHVELAVDTNGCLHVLADARDLRDSSIVAAWAVRHQEILGMACGGLQIDMQATPMQHLFTNDAVSVADLYGSGVRMHLLVDVEIDGHVGVFCTPLN
jgi:hypothetical protein